MWRYSKPKRTVVVVVLKTWSRRRSRSGVAKVLVAGVEWSLWAFHGFWDERERKEILMFDG